MKKTDTSKRVNVMTWKQLTVRVPPEVHRALRVRAAEEGRSCAVIVEGLVRQYLVRGKPA
jgi:predicted HicB family RNase H-like nuclease